MFIHGSFFECGQQGLLNTWTYPYRAALQMHLAVPGAASSATKLNRLSWKCTELITKFTWHASFYSSRRISQLFCEFYQKFHQEFHKMYILTHDNFFKICSHAFQFIRKCMDHGQFSFEIQCVYPVTLLISFFFFFYISFSLS